MREIATVLGGIGLLIFVYLLVKNASGAGKVIGSASGALTNTISVLQGNQVASQSVGG